MFVPLDRRYTSIEKLRSAFSPKNRIFLPHEPTGQLQASKVASVHSSNTELSYKKKDRQISCRRQLRASDPKSNALPSWNRSNPLAINNLEKVREAHHSSQVRSPISECCRCRTIYNFVNLYSRIEILKRYLRITFGQWSERTDIV